MGRGLGIAARLAFGTIVLGCGAWGTLFLWYGSPGGPATAAGLAALFAAASLVAVLALRTRAWPWAGIWAAAFAGLLAWFLALEPRADREWEPDVARNVTATVGPTRLDVGDVRTFDWRTESDYTPRWEERSYDLDRVRTLDLVNSYWAGPVIAHTLLSFGFDDGRFLTFSVEIRREKGETYSSLAGFFRRYEMVVIAADDRDIVRLRTNARGEDTQIYRVRAGATEVRALLVALLERANEVARRPVWYNSLTANCTTELFRILRAVAPEIPFDWRIVLSGYLPDLVYDLRRLDTRLTLPDLRARSRIGDRARALGDDPDFARKIRDGLPDPNAPG